MKTIPYVTLAALLLAPQAAETNATRPNVIFYLTDDMGWAGPSCYGNTVVKTPNVAVRDGRWKLLLDADGAEAQLYDIETDAKETTNLAAQHPDIAKKLSEQALAWRRSLPKREHQP